MSERIVIDQQIHHGQPVIAGTRTPVSVILDSMAAGDSVDLICREYDLTEDDIRACIAFADQNV
jgi:uncharacterized protein (DUF433 family)